MLKHAGGRGVAEVVVFDGSTVWLAKWYAQACLPLLLAVAGVHGTPFAYCVKHFINADGFGCGERYDGFG